MRLMGLAQGQLPTVAQQRTFPPSVRCIGFPRHVNSRDKREQPQQKERKACIFDTPSVVHSAVAIAIQRFVPESTVKALRDQGDSVHGPQGRCYQCL